MYISKRNFCILTDNAFHISYFSLFLFSYSNECMIVSPKSSNLQKFIWSSQDLTGPQISFHWLLYLLNCVSPRVAHFS